MENKIEEITIDLLPNYYLKENGTFDLDEALNVSGKIAGVCYDEEGFNKLKDEPTELTNKRINRTLNSGHLSVYDHIFISFNIHNIPKILAMILNNEKQYTTSEKSARYTTIKRKYDSVITEEQEMLYDKWTNVLAPIIKEKYGHIYKDLKINRLAKENARYFVTVFMPTEMIYTTSLRQINSIAVFMEKYIKEIDFNDKFQIRLAKYMHELLYALKTVKVLDQRLMKNEKNRHISLLEKDIDKKNIYFDDIYITKYKGSFAQLAQAQRHRTIDYSMQFLDNSEFYVPEILAGSDLYDEWLRDMELVKEFYPQGEKVLIKENGTYDNFILKCKERLCSCAQLEIANQTKETLINYRNALIDTDSPLSHDIEKYTNGARCTFPDFNCNSDCNFKEGKTLVRKI